MSIGTDLFLILFGAIVGFIPSFVLREYFETKSKKEKILKGLFATTKLHIKTVDEMPLHDFRLDRGFIKYLLSSGEIILFTDTVISMIIQYDNTVRFANRAIDYEDFGKTKESLNVTVKTVGINLESEIKKEYPKLFNSKSRFPKFSIKRIS